MSENHELRELLSEMEGHLRSDSSYPVGHIRAEIERLFMEAHPSPWIPKECDCGGRTYECIECGKMYHTDPPSADGGKE